MMWDGGYGMVWGGGWGFGLVHMLFSFIVFALFIGLIVSLFTHGLSGRDTRANGRSVGLSVLEERYARGEIGRDEYLEKKRDLLA